jgi:hypothetical protein
MNSELLERVKSAIHLFNGGSDNSEYLRGQIELAMFLIGSDDEELRAELEKIGE